MIARERTLELTRFSKKLFARKLEPLALRQFLQWQIVLLPKSPETW